MKPRNETLLRTIQTECGAIIRQTEGLTFDRLLSDSVLRRAFERQIEIIGESARLLDDTLKKKYPHIPWPAIQGMRNRLIHVYWDVDEEAVWDVVTQDIPQLEKQITAMIQEVTGAPLS